MTVWMLAMRKTHFINWSFPSMGIYGWEIVQGKAFQRVSGRWWSWWGHSFGTMAVTVRTKRGWGTSVFRWWNKKYQVYTKLFNHQTEWDSCGSMGVNNPLNTGADQCRSGQSQESGRYSSFLFCCFFSISSLFPLNTLTLRTKCTCLTHFWSSLWSFGWSAFPCHLAAQRINRKGQSNVFTLALFHELLCFVFSWRSQFQPFWLVSFLLPALSQPGWLDLGPEQPGTVKLVFYWRQTS